MHILDCLLLTASRELTGKSPEWHPIRYSVFLHPADFSQPFEPMVVNEVLYGRYLARFTMSAYGVESLPHDLFRQLCHKHVIGACMRT